MRYAYRGLTVSAAMVLLASTAGAGGPPSGALKKCPADAVVSGSTRMDKYEASVWRVPGPLAVNKGLVAKIQAGSDGARHRGGQLFSVRR